MHEPAHAWTRAAPSSGTRGVRFVTARLAGLLLASISLPASAGDWTITPRITAQEIYTDNVLLTPTNRRSDFITTIAPGLSIAGESPRLQAKVDYAPTLQLYALTPDLNFIGQNLYANATGTVVPELFFVDARGFLSLQPSSPALGTGLLASSAPSLIGPTLVTAAQAIPRSQLAQASSVSVSPYLARRFDGFGTGELRYSFTDTNFSGVQNIATPTPAGTALQNTSTTTNEATAVFLTGENFGRLQSRVLLDAAESSGTTPSNQLVGTIDSAYAVTQRIAALGTIGYERLQFGSIPPTRIEELVWGIGGRFTPNPDLTLVLSYGRRNGFTAPYASFSYNVTARTSVSATYSEGLTTVAQELANNLAVSDLNPAGQTVDTRTLLPFLIANPALGLQGGLFRSKQLTVTAKTDFDRDHFVANLNRSENDLVAQTGLGSGVSQTALQINLTWSREINPRTTTNLGIGYGQFSFAAPANTEETLLTANAGLSYQLNPTLTGSVNYNHLNRMSPQAQFRLLSNIISVGIRKEF